MNPTINNADHLIVDLDQRVIRSGEIYIINYKQSNVVCRLLLDGETVIFVFDAVEQSHQYLLKNIIIIDRVIEIKTLA
jgi:phage repressor protein C with HTH and peptisase S24 domain